MRSGHSVGEGEQSGGEEEEATRDFLSFQTCRGVDLHW